MSEVRVPDTAVTCPKDMTYGPCGGVTATLGCEVDDRPCPFANDDALPRWERPGASRVIDVAPGSIFVDLRPDPTLPGELAEAAVALGLPDVHVLIGEHVDDPTPHGPAAVAAAVADAGLSAVSTVTCRGRTGDELTREVEAVAATGPFAVHCVTGDHPSARLHLDGDVRFGTDSLGLVSMATRSGVAVSVAESPATPPRAWRAPRLADKQRAGAGMCILNHAGDVDHVRHFVEDARDAGVTVPLVAAVPIITDRHSATVLDRFPGLELPEDFAARVLSADDPRAAGIEAAVELGRELLACPGIAGINLSGAGSDRATPARAELAAEIITGIRRR
ncbi:MAG: methylenetetrahydrofolate reductase [Actinomycetota bacterium]|nr:methylenetetrahydrofolate reductase [Actinomycetota bacterium]